MAEPRALYLHVPFCRRICPYCAFDVTPHRNAENQKRFLDGIRCELELLSVSPPRHLESLYVGGGTPSALSSARFLELLHLLRTRVRSESTREWTVELNPEDVTDEICAALRDEGVDRVSLGVQSLDSARLRQLGRLHSPSMVESAVATLRAFGVGNITIDLMYGLPRQTEDEWRLELRRALALEVPHLSLYCLTIEPETAFKRAFDRNRITVPDDEITSAMFLAAIDECSSRGIRWYEVSNFAKAGFESIHNQFYWRNEPYFGLGPAAFERAGVIRSQNPATLDSWSTAVGAGIRQSEDRNVLDPRADFIETLSTGLRTRVGVDLAALAISTGFDARTLASTHVERLIDAGHAILREGRLSLTDRGVLLLDSILMPFLDAVDRAS